MKICVLSSQNFHKKHVSQATVDAVEKALQDLNDVEVKTVEISEFVWKMNRKFQIQIIDMKTLHKVKRFAPDYVFVAAMGPGMLEYLAPLLRKISIPKCAYCFDTWKETMEKWKAAFRYGRIDYAMCAYLSSVPEFSRFCKKVGFLPQSMNSEYFFPVETEKTHLFMQMGRKNQMLDTYVKRYLQENQLSEDLYIREKVPGQIIYPEFEQLGQEINKTHFFLVSPRNVDEQDFTGNISDVTARFYEGMACKTMLVGIKPKDTFDQLFPYENAMIEVASYEQFQEQVDFYLTHPKEYCLITERNYHYLMNNHTWSHRAKTIIEFLQN